ncbi:hypothetical protein [Thermomonospora umbrina]|uniref:Surface-anchored protein n=1 Tax=Thermomonospora umbrina TaxID=111806 RepID=A0A3D9STC1_9ACTN|nr:hypothetical protein [Thermomonospora umbrina]REE97253.1 hypothetical protein DFJ69_2718 [Thermomonospora umbrina]
MKRALTLVAVSALALPVLAPAAAHADPTPPVAPAKAGTLRITPGTAVLDAQKSTPVTFHVRLPGLGKNSWVDLTARGPRGDIEFGDAKDPDGDGVFTATIRFDRYSEAGVWRVESEIFNIDTGDDYAGPSGSFNVKRRTRLGVNAAPEPVKKGRTLTVSGRLTQLTKYGYPDFSGYKGQRIHIQFKRRGSATWVNKGYATTDGGGKYVKRFTANLDGTWRAWFKGTATHVPVVSGVDHVDVR